MITTVFFDMGGTLEYIRQDTYSRAAGTERIRTTLEDNGILLSCTNKQLMEELIQERAAYLEWRKGTNVELPPEELWSQFMLRFQNVDLERILTIAETLANIWENTMFCRMLRPETRQTLEGLRARGYRIGIISNNTSRTQVFECLDSYQIRSYMETVCVSACIGYAKPHPMIFQYALQQMHVDAASCVYVGDDLVADVLGAKQAGFAKTVWMSKDADDKSRTATLIQPNLEIVSLSELLPWLDAQSERE